MSQSKELCKERHICMDCKQPWYCETYKWACPWINEDEIQMCDACCEKFAQEMLKWEESQGAE